MNTPYFICEACKIRIEAGYRWATSHLRSDARIVEFGRLLNVRDALDYQPFWDLPSDNEYNWLRNLLPIVRTFLERHESHGVRFGDDVSFPESYFGIEWLDVSPSPDLVPRYFVEQLGYNSWRQVCDHVESLSLNDQPWWWSYADEQRAAKRLFETLADKLPITKR